jgi:hypothetical protein
MREVIQELSTQLCIQIFKHEKRKEYFKQQQASLPPLHTTTTDRRNMTDIFKHVEPRPYIAENTDGAEAAQVYEDSYFDCDHCGTKVSSARYAPHLERCMTSNQRSTTGKPTTAIRGSSSRRSTRNSKRMYDDFLHDDFLDEPLDDPDDDEEFEEHKPKTKRPSKKKKITKEVVKTEQAPEQPIKVESIVPQETTAVHQELEALFPTEQSEFDLFPKDEPNSLMQAPDPNFWDL